MLASKDFMACTLTDCSVTGAASKVGIQISNPNSSREHYYLGMRSLGCSLRRSRSVKITGT